MAEVLRVQNREDWRHWLSLHHLSAGEIWLAIQKVKSTKAGIKYLEAVEEAIAFGWIDGKMRHLDGEEFMLRFTLRRSDSFWSFKNRIIAERLMAEGRMADKGIARVEEAKKNGRWDSAYSSLTAPAIPFDLEEILKNRGAWENFNRISNSAKLQWVFWVNEAKRSQTRNRRITELIKKISKVV